MSKQEWSKDWKASKNPSKQRKYRRNAPQHVKDKLVSANLSQELRDELGTRNIQLNLGDRVKVTRGDRKGAEGIISGINRDKQKIYINGLEVERQDGSTSEKGFRPSNLQVKALNLEEDDRIEEYGIGEAADELSVDSEEVEEALEEDEENEMMQQMQGGGQQAPDIDEEELEELEEEIEEDEEEAEQLEEEAEELEGEIEEDEEEDDNQ
ncbi:MAG: 50S ribosomal protein L24 [Candidatus Nanohalobium sp.]